MRVPEIPYHRGENRLDEFREKANAGGTGRVLL
jgi:hypothetical protein